MHVLHVYKTYLPDNFQGIPRTIWEIAQSTHPLGITSEVLSLSPAPTPATIRIADHVSHRARQDIFLASTGFSLSAFALYRRLASRADVVHYHFPWPAMDLLHFSAPRRPSVVTYHSDIVRQRLLAHAYAPLMHAFLRSVDRIVATSPNYRDSSPVLRQYLHKVDVIPLGLSDRLEPGEARIHFWRERLPAVFLLFVGAFRYYKGLDFLIEAAKRTGIHIVLAGDTAFARAFGDIPSNVHLLGAVNDEDREALLTLCAGFVFPSHLRSEAFGIALLEAARAGRPMISCEIGTGTSFVNVDGSTGYVIPPHDVAALSKAMRDLIGDRANAEQMGSAARSRYERIFTSDAMARRYLELYCAAAGNTSGMSPCSSMA